MLEIAAIIAVMLGGVGLVLLAIWYGGKSEEVKRYENENETMRRARAVRERAKRLYRSTRR